MIKNDWVYALLIGFISVLIPTLAYIILESFELRTTKKSNIGTPIFILSVVLPFWIGIGIRKVKSYKRGLTMGLLTSLISGLLTIPLMILSLIYQDNKQELKSSYFLPISMGSIVRLLFSVSSLLTPLFRKKHWNKESATSLTEDILDH